MNKTVTSACAAFLFIAPVSAFTALQDAPPQVQKKPDVTLATGHKGDILAVAFGPDGRLLAV